MEGVATSSAPSSSSSASEVVTPQPQQTDNKPATATTTTTTTTTTAAPPTRLSQQEAVERFLCIYNHAVSCTQSPCTTYPAKCAQFRRLIAHTRTCAKIKINECELCRQTIALTIIHAKTCRDEACCIPYCGTIKSRIDEMNEMRARVESAYEVVYAGVKLIAPSTLSASVQATSSTTLLSAETTNTNVETVQAEETNQAVEIEEEEAERVRLLTEIERVKSSTNLPTSHHNHHHHHHPKPDVKFSKELAKFIFKKSMTSHQLGDVCYKNVHFARLAKLFMQENLDMIRQISASSNSRTSREQLDDYLLLVIDLARRFDALLAKFTRRSVECQTETEEEEKSGCEQAEKKRPCDDSEANHDEDDSAAKRMRLTV